MLSDVLVLFLEIVFGVIMSYKTYFVLFKKMKNKCKVLVQLITQQLIHLNIINDINIILNYYVQ